MSGVNKVILVGNLGQAPEMHTTKNDLALANLSLATSEKFNDKSGQKQERTEWHKVVMFGSMAKLAQNYLAKGSKIYLEGRIQTRKWEDKDGNTRYTTEIVGQNMVFLGDKSNNRGSAEQPSPKPHPYSPSDDTPREFPEDDLPEDDLPF